MSATGRPGSGFSCPKCGAKQPRGEECVHCGIVFAKYYAAQNARERARPVAPTRHAARPEPAPATAGWLKGLGAVAMAVLVITAVRLVAHLDVWPWNAGSADLEAEIAANPMFQAMRTHTPDDFQHLLEIVRTGNANGDSKASIGSRVQSFAATFATRHLPTASDDALFAYADAMDAMMRAVRAENPAACAQAANGAYVDVRSMSDAAQSSLAGEMALAMAQVIESAVTSPAPPVHPGWAERVLEEKVLPKVDAQFATASFAGVPPPQSLDCDVSLAMLQHVRALPDNERAAVLRYMMSQ